MRTPTRAALDLLTLGAIPALGYGVLWLTGATHSLTTLTSVAVGAVGGPRDRDVIFAVLSELCWLGWRIVTPACIVAALPFALWAGWRRLGRSSASANVPTSV